MGKGDILRQRQRAGATPEELAVVAHAVDLADGARRAAAEARRQAAALACAPGCLNRGAENHDGCNRDKKCSHYSRKCLLKAKCCGKYFPCRKCHDEVEDHKIDRFATEFVACKVCRAEDVPVGERCTNCGVKFAEYYCRVCQFFDDDTAKNGVYHCDRCGICRVGRGLGIDNRHCDGCNACVPIEVADSHPCTTDALKGNCPVCAECMATSTEQVIYMRCGHAMHGACFSQYTEQSYTCPVCWKSLTDMTQWYRALDAKIASEPELPPQFARRRKLIQCNDCAVKSVAKFHFQFFKCGGCAGYNTRVIGEAADAESPTCSDVKPGGKADDSASMTGGVKQKSEGGVRGQQDVAPVGA
jgi:uncharacterized CHY-type Zn-finger protein